MQGKQRARGDRGVAMIMTGLILVPLMMFAAFGVDLASWYSRISFLQKAADAAALAGTVWMPDFAKATSEAKASLRDNGVVDKDEGGTDDIDVVVAVGSKPTSVKVTLTDNSAEPYFSQVFAGNQTLTRSGEAEYNLPIPLGSPLNYFGGDSTKTAQPSVTTYAVAWPGDYTTRTPMTTPCNLGTSSGQNLGRWAGSPATYRAGEYGSGDPQCRWRATGSAGAGSSTIPPPDHTTRPPTPNVNCRARVDGVGTVFGRWRNGAWQNSTGGGDPTCTWAIYTTTAGSLPAGYDTEVPTNQPCVVGYEAALGSWAGSTFAVPAAASQVGGSTAQGNQLCQWGPRITSNTVTPPNPISPTRSPGFWAMIEGPGTVSTNGDAYNTRCYINNNCGSVQNAQHKDSTDPDRGFWYVVKIPTSAIGPVDINVFDASYHPGGDTDTLAGDRNLGSSTVFPTEFRVFTQSNPLDFSVRTPYSGATSGNQADGSCYWTLGSESAPPSTAFSGVWRRLCTIASPTPGGTYLINVQTTGTVGNGVNGYAIEAVAGGATQPALYAHTAMGMQNNNDGSPPPPATFYLAEVGAQYAGKTLVIDLWDPGDATGNASLFPKKPSPTLPKPVVDVPAADCEYTASPSPSAVQTTSNGGPTGNVYLTPRASDFGTRCGIRSTISGARQFNGEWLSIRVAIPADYTCLSGINPEAFGNSCWWGIEYNFSSSANDVTTWRARIEGNPVHLTQ